MAWIRSILHKFVQSVGWIDALMDSFGVVGAVPSDITPRRCPDLFEGSLEAIYVLLLVDADSSTR